MIVEGFYDSAVIASVIDVLDTIISLKEGDSPLNEHQEASLDLRPFLAKWIPRILVAVLLVYIVGQYRDYRATTLRVDLVIPDKFVGTVEVDYSDSPTPQPNGNYKIHIKDGRAIFPAKFKKSNVVGDFEVHSITTESGEVLKPHLDNASIPIDVVGVGMSTDRPRSHTEGDTFRIGQAR